MIKLFLKDGYETRVMIAKKGFTLLEFANEIELSSGYLSQILNGDRNPSPGVAHKIATGLSLKIDDLFIIETKQGAK